MWNRWHHFFLLIFPVKNWGENSISLPIHPGITFEYDYPVGLRARKGRGRDGEGGSDEQPLSDKPPLIRGGETYSTLLE